MDSYLLEQYRKTVDNWDDDSLVSVFVSKKYEPVALKVKPVYTELSEEFRIKHEIRYAVPKSATTRFCAH